MLIISIFCNMKEFTTAAPCVSSELVHFRKWIGEKGIGLIFQASIRVNNENEDSHHHDTAFINSTVQEKNISFPIDAKLHKKIVTKVVDIVKKLGLPLRQSYTFVLKRIYREQRFRNHPKNRKKALKAAEFANNNRQAGRELKRNLGENHDYDYLHELFEAILSPKRSSRKKIYSIHKPEVQCIAKGKEHKKYEFGNKVSIIRSATSIILGAMLFRNEYNGHTIEPLLAQVERLTERKIKVLAGDRGYRGKKKVNRTKIMVPDVPKKSDSCYLRLEKHKLFCKRADIESSIGHLKFN